MLNATINSTRVNPLCPERRREGPGDSARRNMYCTSHFMDWMAVLTEEARARGGAASAEGVELAVPVDSPGQARHSARPLAEIPVRRFPRQACLVYPAYPEPDCRLVPPQRCLNRQDWSHRLVQPSRPAPFPHTRPSKPLLPPRPLRYGV